MISAAVSIMASEESPEAPALMLTNMTEIAGNIKSSKLNAANAWAAVPPYVEGAGYSWHCSGVTGCYNLYSPQVTCIRCWLLSISCSAEWADLSWKKQQAPS